MIRKLCNVDQLPAEGQLKGFSERHATASGDAHAVAPLDLCVGVLDGVPYAIANACPHQGAPLAGGHVEDGCVVCPIHAWKWRLRDGEPERPSDPAIPCYETRVYGDEVFVRIPTPSARKA